MKLHFKIVSHSSEDISNPVTNLVAGSGMWQSARFCQYPQQITIQFYEPVTVSSIHIASHPSKITSRVNILFCLVDKVKMNPSLSFQKYGYFQFSDNQNSDLRLRELKKLQGINVNASYMRLMLWKNHQNAQNFFNQIGLSQLMIYGSPYAMTAQPLPPAITNKSGIMGLQISQYIETKLQVLQQFKHNFSKQDDFQNAKKIKQIIKVIKSHGEKLRVLDSEKKNAVGSEEYDKAKQIKIQMENLRHDIEFVANNFYDPHKKQINSNLKDTRLKARFDEILSNSGNFSRNESRVSNKPKKVDMEALSQEKQVVSQNEASQKQDQQEEEFDGAKSKVSYDNRIIPAVLNKNKKQTTIDPQNIPQDGAYEENQFLQKPKNEQQVVLQEMTPSAEVNAAVLLEMFDKEVVRKLHSKHWNFKLQALTTIMEETKKWISSSPQLEKNKVKSVLFTFNKIIKQGNFQLNNLNLDLLAQLAGSKKKAAEKVQAELHSELEKSLNQIFLKMGDSQKIKQKCQDIITKMQGSDLYGVNLIFQTLAKSYFNQGLTHNVKIKKYKLAVIQNLLQQYGIGSKNGLPIAAVDFMCKVAQDNNQQIRKQATLILKKMKQKGAGNKVVQVVRSKQSLKGSIIKQLQS